VIQPLQCQLVGFDMRAMLDNDAVEDLLLNCGELGRRGNPATTIAMPYPVYRPVVNDGGEPG
jgi:hypothetical protein